jgi:hypothetical protein
MTGFIGTPSMWDIEDLRRRLAVLEERWEEHPDYVRRGPTVAEWGCALDESWGWFEKNLGRTPNSYDVQMWIDGYVPRS